MVLRILILGELVWRKNNGLADEYSKICKCCACFFTFESGQVISGIWIRGRGTIWIRRGWWKERFPFLSKNNDSYWILFGSGSYLCFVPSIKFTLVCMALWRVQSRIHGFYEKCYQCKYFKHLLFIWKIHFNQMKALKTY